LQKSLKNVGSSVQARSHGGAFGAVLPQIYFVFLCLPNFVAPRKICFKLIVKAKILPPQKCIVPHQILKPGYGPGSVSRPTRLTVATHTLFASLITRFTPSMDVTWASCFHKSDITK